MTFNQTHNVQINLWTLALITDQIAAVNLFPMFPRERLPRQPLENHPEAHVSRHLPSPRLSLPGLVVPLPWDLDQLTDAVTGAQAWD